MRSSNIFFKLWPYIWSKQTHAAKIKFLLFIFATLITTAALISIPVILKQAILILDGEPSLPSLSAETIVFLYCLSWMLSKVIDRLRHQSAFPIIAHVIHCLCLELFTHLQHLSIKFHHEKRSGELLNTIARTRYAIAAFMQATAQEIMPLFLQLMLASILLTLAYGPLYSIILLSMLFFYTILSILTSNSILKIRQEQNIIDGRASGFIIDRLLNTETVKYFATEKLELEQVKTHLKHKESADLKSLMTDAKIHLIQNTIIGLSVIGLTVVSGVSVLQKQLHISDFVMINNLTLMFMSPLSNLGYRYRQAKSQLGHLENAFQILDEPLAFNNPKSDELKVTSGQISFNNISFSYNSRQILKNLNFMVPAGTTTAIVGASGSGKSSIAKLLLRLYEPDTGSIQIDGQQINKVTRASLCKIIGIVPQDTMMFNDSIKNNIFYSLRETSTSIDLILKSVDLYEFINQLPLKAETLVGERGLKLSGGQRQRLAIARMIARNPQIMVFDEATSSLDLNTENKIQKCIKTVSKGLTTIIIAHRLSTIAHADNILVLENGSIVEKGTHQELIAQHGLYKELLAKEASNKKSQ